MMEPLTFCVSAVVFGCIIIICFADITRDLRRIIITTVESKRTKRKRNSRDTFTQTKSWDEIVQAATRENEVEANSKSEENRPKKMKEKIAKLPILIKEHLAKSKSTDEIRKKTKSTKKEKVHSKENSSDSSDENGSENGRYEREAEESWKEAKEILKDEEGWKTKEGDDPESGVVFRKQYEENYFKLKAQVNTSPENLFTLLVTDIDKYPEWNRSVADASVVTHVKDHIDIVYIVTKPALGGIVSSRDFVNLRCWKKLDGAVMSSNVFTTHSEKPETDDHTRGEQRPQGVWFKPVEDEPEMCDMEMLLSVDIKPSRLYASKVDSHMPTTVMEFLEDIRNRVNGVKSGD